MNDYIRRNLEAGQRTRQWFIDYAALIPAASIFETKVNAMVAIVNLLETTAGEQEAAEAAGYGATDVKGSERNDMFDVMDPVRNAARAAEWDVPGTRDRYRFNRAMSHQDLLAAGRSFALGGATDAALLVSYGAPAGWPAAITAACDAYEAAFALQDSAKGQSVAKNAELMDLVEQMNAYKSPIRHLVKNYAATQVGALAAWDTAAHVEKPPKPEDPPPPPPPPPGPEE